MADDLEKTEEPTPKKREEARREGTIAISTEVFTVANLLAVTLALMTLGANAAQRSAAAFPRIWAPRDDLTVEGASMLLRDAFAASLPILLPIFAAAVVAGILAGLAQTRGAISFKKLKPRASKLNPLKGASRIFKKTAPIELPKSILKMAVTGVAIGIVVGPNLDEYRGLQQIPLLPAFVFSLDLVLRALLAGAIALILVAAIDYAYQFWQTEKSLKMTKSEVDDERKQSQGDPLVRRRLMSIMMEKNRQRMMQAVPEADVVVTNPEHISVALRYDRVELAAPIVVAKGAGHIAMKIREIAREAGVPIVENKPLARTLFRSVKVGQLVPESLFQAVAEVLAYVYRLDRARGASW